MNETPKSKGRPKDKPGDKELRAKSKVEILAARRLYENAKAICPRCGHGVERFPCWQCGYGNSPETDIISRMEAMQQRFGQLQLCDRSDWIQDGDPTALAGESEADYNERTGRYDEHMVS